MTKIRQSIENEFQQLSFYEQIDLIGRLLEQVRKNSDRSTCWWDKIHQG